MSKRNIGVVMYLANFKKYWREHLAHLAVGFLIGATFNVPLAMLVCTRQSMEYVRSRDVAHGKGDVAGKDTPGLDLSYHVGGAAVGAICLAYIVWRLLGGI